MEATSKSRRLITILDPYEVTSMYCECLFDILLTLSLKPLNTYIGLRVAYSHRITFLLIQILKLYTGDSGTLAYLVPI